MDVRIIAIGALALMESVALITHTDGAFFLPVAAIIGGLAGYTVGVKKCERHVPVKHRREKEG